MWYFVLSKYRTLDFSPKPVSLLRKWPLSASVSTKSKGNPKSTDFRRDCFHVCFYDFQNCNHFHFPDNSLELMLWDSIDNPCYTIQQEKQQEKHPNIHMILGICMYGIYTFGFTHIYPERTSWCYIAILPFFSPNTLPPSWEPTRASGLHPRWPLPR